MTLVRLQLPVRSPYPLSVPWTWVAPASIEARALATPSPMSSWVWMPSPDSEAATGILGHRVNLGRQRAAVRVAEHDEVGAAALGSLPRRERVCAVVLAAVERVLGVVHDELAMRFEVPHGIFDHGQVFCRRRLQDLEDVQEPRLAVDRDDGRRGVEEQPDLIVRLRADVFAARGAERCEARAPERPVLRLLKELDVLGVAARPAAFDVMHTERVQALGNPQLVGDRQRNALPLRAVPQRGVVDLDVNHLSRL